MWFDFRVFIFLITVLRDVCSIWRNIFEVNFRVKLFYEVLIFFFKIINDFFCGVGNFDLFLFAIFKFLLKGFCIESELLFELCYWIVTLIWVLTSCSNFYIYFSNCWYWSLISTEEFVFNLFSILCSTFSCKIKNILVTISTSSSFES